MFSLLNEYAPNSLATGHMTHNQKVEAAHETGCKLGAGSNKFKKCVASWKKAHPSLAVCKHAAAGIVHLVLSSVRPAVAHRLLLTSTLTR